ncbi:unnamed protein product [Camellia sinensis]
MAAFANYQQHLSLLDPIFLQNTSGFSQEPNTTTTTSCFSQFYPLESLQQVPVDVSVHESKVAISHNNEASVTNKHSTDSSSVVDKSESGEQVTQKLIATAKKRKNKDESFMTSLQSMDAREVRDKKKQKTSNGTTTTMTDEKEKKPKADKKKDQKKVPTEEVLKDYIHVRARRGQATDNHSLAERVRREKIGERMKLLQALVPGCDKVTGKALVLDEIISYVRSLQYQVEVLSMKLASVNPMFYDFGMELDAFMVPHETLMNYEEESPLPNVQQCNSAQFTTPNSYPLLDSSSSSLLFDHQQEQIPNIFPQVIMDSCCGKWMTKNLLMNQEISATTCVISINIILSYRFPPASGLQGNFTVAKVGERSSRSSKHFGTPQFYK